MISRKLTPQKKIEIVLNILSNERTLEEVACEHGVTISEVEDWRAFYIAAAQNGNRAKSYKSFLPKGRRFSRLAPAAAALAALLLLAGGGVVMAASQDCPNDYAFCFNPNTPAKAGQVNYNFTQIQDWVEAKIGTAGDPNVTISGTAFVDGTTTLNGATTLNEATTFEDMITINGGANVGVGVGGGIVLTDDSGYTLRVDGNEIASNYSGGLHLNPDGEPKLPVKVGGTLETNFLHLKNAPPTMTTSSASGTGQGDADSYFLATDASCDETSEVGKIEIFKISNQDSLCYCGNISDTVQWNCFNP